MNSLKPHGISILVATLLVLVVGSAMAQVPALPEEETTEYTRTGVFFALNLGAGGAEGRFGIADHPEITQDRELGVAVNARLGYAVKPWLLAGVNGIAWLKNYDLVDGDTGEMIPADVSYSIAGVFVHAFYYKSFFVRGLMGRGYTHVAPRGGTRIEERGLGYAFGLGWEGRMTETLALTPVVEYGRVLINNVLVDDGNGGVESVDPSAIFVNASLGLTWYF
jgi:hypothetical protein